MPITIFTGRDFNQDVSKAKRATKKGPVTITDRDRPTHVLLGAEDHESFIRRQASIADLLVIPDAADIEFDQQSLEGKLFGMTDLSWVFLLDTNVVSELRKAASGKCDTNVKTRADATSATAHYLSAASALGIELGILSTSRRDATQGAVLRAWMDQRILPAFDDRIVPVDTVVAQRYARLHVPDPQSDRDALITATALVHGLTLVTRNTNDAAATDVELINPWTPTKPSST